MFPIADAQLFLKAMMLGVSDEVYLIDASTMQMVYMSESAREKTGLDIDSFKRESIDNMLGVSKKVLETQVKHSRNQAHFVEMSNALWTAELLLQDFDLGKLFLSNFFAPSISLVRQVCKLLFAWMGYMG